MERHMDDLLAGLKMQLLKMSAMTETMIADAVSMLVNRDVTLMKGVTEREQQVNLMQVEIDENCLNLIALHQPTAGDLRFILGAAKTNAELERLADQAVNICQKAEELIKEPPIQPFELVPPMAKVAGEMVKDSLHAFVNRDVARARDVLVRDAELDEYKRRITNELVKVMQADGTTVSRALALALVARNLERIGDHATNIAENAIFVAEGRDVRHHLEEAKRSNLES